ncbi:MAG: DUF397 domain-containing protein [Nocardiopsis sp. BM-2018]|nr:MAG: DUF397 domain-containing protein [Nocardiopsis sp. BM-2018]
MHTPGEDLTFRKSLYSQIQPQNCVKVADLPGASAVSDIQNRSLGALTFPSSEWAALAKIAQGSR